MSDTKLNADTEAALADIETGGTANADANAATQAQANAATETPPANATEPTGDANGAGNAAANNDAEKTYTEQEVNDMMSGRLTAERARYEKELQHVKAAQSAKTNKPAPDAQQSGAQQQSQDDNIQVSKERLESMVREEAIRHEEQRVFMNHVNALNNELYKARQEDPDFDALCAELPNEVSQKFFMVFAGQEHAAKMIKTILHDKALSQDFVACKDPMQMSHLLGRVHSAMNTGAADTNNGNPARPLKTGGAKQSDTSIGAIENDLYD